MKITVPALALAMAVAMQSAFAQAFLERQVWSYKSRSGEEASTVLINKVEFSPKAGQIFHISVRGLRMRDRVAPSGMTTELPHLPVSVDTLKASCTKLVGESEPHPNYRDGYAHWRRAFDQGQAGIWTAPVAEIVQALEDGMNR
jgi:hypothetical protein